MDQYLKLKNLTPCTDPKLLAVFNTIKQDLGIQENIPLYIDNTSFLKSNNMAAFNSLLNLISINSSVLHYMDNTQLIHIMAHELGHYLQWNGYIGNDQLSDNYRTWSASKKQLNDVATRLETGADATADGYQDCKDCLTHIANQHHAVSDYYELGPCGYFTKNDHDPYIKRATEEGWQCRAHEKNSAQHSLANQFMDFRKFELEDFLPQTYDRSGYKPSPLVQAASAKE